jgi:hypothetical protein
MLSSFIAYKSDLTFKQRVAPATAEERGILGRRYFVTRRVKNNDAQLLSVGVKSVSTTEWNGTKVQHRVFNLLDYIEHIGGGHEANTSLPFAL